MKAKFEITKWLGENRTTVIAKYEELKNEQFFNGITLKSFMLEIVHLFKMNRVASEKRAEFMLPNLMGSVYFNNSKTYAFDAPTERLKAQYSNNGQYMSMI